MNYAGPHPPFAITESMNETVKNRKYDLPINNTNISIYDNLIIRRNYIAEIENIDNNFGKIIDLIKSYNEFDNTIICISSDHGEMLGDYQLFNKQYPWSGSLSVPLVCMGPNIIKNQIINTPVTNMDLAGTFLDYSNTKIPTNQSDVMTTKSLRDVLEGKETSNREYVISGFNFDSGLPTNPKSWRTVLTKINEATIWKYVCCNQYCAGRFFNTTIGNFTHALFNIANDIYEQINLVEFYPQRAKELQKLLPMGYCCSIAS